jgi:hypothetical protein
MQMVKASFRLGPDATQSAIDAAINKTMDAARMAFGNAPFRACMVIDKSGYNTVVRAMVGRVA